MIFSKTFAYALRGILYIAATGNEKKKIRVEDISMRIGMPKYFLAKVLNKMVKADILTSVKGPNGGFYIKSHTLDTPLIKLYQVLDGSDLHEGCELHLRKCNEINYCPIHFRVEIIRKNIVMMLSETTIRDLLQDEQQDFIRSISFRISSK